MTFPVCIYIYEQGCITCTSRWKRQRENIITYFFEFKGIHMFLATCKENTENVYDISPIRETSAKNLGKLLILMLFFNVGTR